MILVCESLLLFYFFLIYSFLFLFSSPPPRRFLPASLLLEDVDEVQERDEVLYYDELCSVGELAGLGLEPILSQLTSHIEGRLMLLMQAPAGQPAVVLFEELHWLVLIAGNILTNDGDGETVLIPKR